MNTEKYNRINLVFVANSNIVFLNRFPHRIDEYAVIQIEL